MYCHSCGGVLPEGAMFCPSCGSEGIIPQDGARPAPAQGVANYIAPSQAVSQGPDPVSPPQGQPAATAFSPAYAYTPYPSKGPVGAATTTEERLSGLANKATDHARGLPALFNASTANKLLGVAIVLGVIAALVILFGDMGSYTSSTITSEQVRHYNGYRDTYEYETEWSTSWSDTTLTIASAQFGLPGFLAVIAGLAGAFLVYRSMLTDDPVRKWKYLRYGFLLPIGAILVMLIAGAAFASWAASKEYDEVAIGLGLGWGVTFGLLQVILVLIASTFIPRPANVQPVLPSAVMVHIERGVSMVRQSIRPSATRFGNAPVAEQGTAPQTGYPPIGGPSPAPYYPPVGSTTPPPWNPPRDGGQS